MGPWLREFAPDHATIGPLFSCTVFICIFFPLISGYRVEMLDIQSGTWIEITFIEGYEPKCTLSNILYGIMYREGWAKKWALGCVSSYL